MSLSYKLLISFICFFQLVLQIFNVKPIYAHQKKLFVDKQIEFRLQSCVWLNLRSNELLKNPHLFYEEKNNIFYFEKILNYFIIENKIYFKFYIYDNKNIFYHLVEESNLILTENSNYSIIIGAGGSGGQRTGNGNGARGSTGSNSLISGPNITTITSNGGGYGGRCHLIFSLQVRWPLLLQSQPPYVLYFSSNILILSLRSSNVMDDL